MARDLYKSLDASTAADSWLCNGTYVESERLVETGRFFVPSHSSILNVAETWNDPNPADCYDTR